MTLYILKFITIIISDIDFCCLVIIRLDYDRRGALDLFYFTVLITKGVLSAA